MDASECPHNRDGLCQVSTRLAAMPVPIADDACQACLQQKSPCTINRVTCSKAIQIRLAAGMPAPQELLDCVRPPESGVGTELARMIDTTRGWLHMLRLDWIIPQPVACGCGPIRAAMNYDSPQQCWQKRAFYARNILQSLDLILTRSAIRTAQAIADQLLLATGNPASITKGVQLMPQCMEATEQMSSGSE